MKKLYFSGIVHPERAQLSVSNIENAILDQDGEEYARIKFNIYNNQITTLIESEEENLHTLRNVARSTVQVITDVFGFLKGRAYDIEITKVFSESIDMTYVFGVGVPALEERCKDSDMNSASQIIYSLCLGTEGIFFKRSLSDLGMAIRHADDTAFYCYRALESLKQYFAGKFDLYENGDRAQWQKMSESIGGSTQEVEKIRNLAFPARHGVPEPVTDEDRRDMFLVSWEIVERFANYRLEESDSSYRLHLFTKKTASEE